MRKIINFKNGFSLVEVMLSLVLISLVMVAMAPVVVKNFKNKEIDGVVYKFSKSNTTTQNNVCYQINASGGYDSVHSCSEYVFTVPNGIFHVNLTLVAGGGGGGGAAGSLIVKNSYEDSATAAILSNPIIGAKIDYMNTIGSDGTEDSHNAGNKDNCKNPSGDAICAGKGGSSSYTISNLEVPKNFLKEFRQTANILNLPTSTSITTQITSDVPLFKIEPNGTATTPFIEYDIDSSGAKCATNGIGTGAHSVDDIGNSTAASPIYQDLFCGITEENFYTPKAGEFGNSLIATETVKNGMILVGGSGGKLNSSLNKGSGGSGNSIKLKCSDPLITTCQASAATVDGSAIDGTDEGGAYIKTTIQTEEFRGRGGGGSGGAAVRILGFAVNPGDKYIIRVGKGGIGGGAGHKTIGATGSASNDGISGEGGTTTAIYRLTENASGNLVETLEFMVNGGIGGSGGSGAALAAGTIAPVAASNRIQPTLFSRAENVNVDTNITNNLGTAATGGFAARSFDLTYPIFEDVEPYQTLNENDAADTQIGGLSEFVSAGATLPEGQAQINRALVYKIYTGFYHRRLVNGELAYIGGLGGFSGLGSKAGCGGFFGGNADGIDRGGVQIPGANGEFIKNKFLVDGRLYEVSKYYDNCTIQNPNGQKANFVDPNPYNLTFGQAGSGGGGGGYSVELGSGAGGDGQDGYLMIDWQK